MPLKRQIYCQPLTLVQTVRSLCLSKIDYDSPLYGLGPKSQIIPIQTLLNNALHLALGGICPAPVINLYLESNIPPTLEHFTSKPKFSSTVAQSSDTPLKSLKKIKNKKTLKYRNSVLHKNTTSYANLFLPCIPIKILPKS